VHPFDGQGPVLFSSPYRPCDTRNREPIALFSPSESLSLLFSLLSRSTFLSAVRDERRIGWHAYRPTLIPSTVEFGGGVWFFFFFFFFCGFFFFGFFVGFLLFWFGLFLFLTLLVWIFNPPSRKRLFFLHRKHLGSFSIFLCFPYLLGVLVQPFPIFHTTGHLPGFPPPADRLVFSSLTLPPSGLAGPVASSGQSPPSLCTTGFHVFWPLLPVAPTRRAISVALACPLSRPPCRRHICQHLQDVIPSLFFPLPFPPLCPRNASPKPHFFFYAGRFQVSVS